MYWTTQDIYDTLRDAMELLDAGDAATDEATQIEAHARARRGIARARQMTGHNLLLIAEQTATTAAAVPAPAAHAPTRPAPASVHDADAVAAHPAAFLPMDVQLVRALAGPYEGKALVMYPGRTRWIVRDEGGTRTSVHTAPEGAPADAIPDHLFPGLKVEGYYRADGSTPAALWTPIVALADRAAGVPT